MELAGKACWRLGGCLYQSPQEKICRDWARAEGDRTLRLQYDLTAESWVLDLGGYQGQWASDIFAVSGCRVDVFEPVKSFAEQMKNRFAKNPRIRVFGFGLGASDRKETITINGAASSCVRSGSGAKSEEIEIKSILSFLKKEGSREVALMKVNIEGGEYELLEALLNDGAISRVRDLQVQFHDFVSGAEERRAALHIRLQATHRLTYEFPFIWENWRRLS